jgi:type IV pilus assembly protein PilP
MNMRIPVLLLSCALAACGGDGAGKAMPAPAPRRDAAKKAPAVEKEEAAPAPVPVEYAYSPVGKRDPFRSILDAAAEARPDQAARPDCGPLCKWEIDQLRLVAVISGMSNPLGMVEDPGGKGYIVRRGTFMGKRNGKVTQIRAGEVVVTEIFKDQMGKPHPNLVVIKLPSEKAAVEEDQNLLGPDIAD